MAWVTLERHLAQHHLDSEKLFFKRALEGQQLTRKAPRDITTGKRAAEPVSPAGAAPASRASTEHTQPSGAERGAGTAGPPRGMDRSSGDRVRVSETPERACVKRDAIADEDGTRVVQHTRADRGNVNGNNNGTPGGSASGRRRGSGKGTSNLSASASTSALCGPSLRAGGRRLSYHGDVLEGLHLDRLTRGKTGVVKLIRNERPRREVWSIFIQDDPRVKKEHGQGHLFAPVKALVDWCDACSLRIESEALRCKYCSYTCHLHCEGLVRLDCHQGESQTEGTPTIAPCRSFSNTPPLKNATKEDEDEKSLTEEEIQAKIEEYNSRVSENGMKLAENGNYTGFIRVHLKLRRPVSLLPPDGKNPGFSAAADERDSRTSFYMPNESVKQLHVSSSTTVTEVIQGLLKKYLMEDNPSKFSLYQQTHRDGQDLLQKLSGSEYPLVLRLLAGPDPENLTFVLRENETGDVEWHAFSVPELQNFLAILEKEERERLNVVRQRYVNYRKKLLEALQEVQNKPD